MRSLFSRRHRISRPHLSLSVLAASRLRLTLEMAEDDGEFRACVEFVSELTPDLLARVDPENQLLLFALSQVR